MSLRIQGRIAASPSLIEICVEKDTIHQIGAAVSPADGVIGGDDFWISPGFFDIQVNGYAGVDFNSTGLQPDNARHVVSKLREKGVLLFLPTLVTHSFEHLQACFTALARACREPEIGRAVPAFHLEGPYLSRQDGPRGAHPFQHIRNADWEEFLRFQEAADGRIGMVTVAPEVPGVLRFIEKLCGKEIVVAIGHTGAAPELIREAVRAGAKTSTHLGNGSHLKIPRHRNYVWEQLACDELYASFIVDGHHLPPSVVKCMIRAKGLRRSILTSDAISAAGMPPGSYRLGEAAVVVRPDGWVERVDQAGTGILAGSALDLLRGVENCSKFAGTSVEDSIAMASINPAELMGLSHRIGRLEPGCEANLLLFKAPPVSGALDLRVAVHAGAVVYRA
jgi:N-acetylglucosamine-6-phosphate deacetylase